MRGQPIRAVSLSRNLAGMNTQTKKGGNPLTSTSNLVASSNEYQQIRQTKMTDLRKRNLSVISPSVMLTDQSEGRSSYSYGSKNSQGRTFEASHILKRKIGGLARRNIAMETTRNAIEEMSQTGMSRTGKFGGHSNMRISHRDHAFAANDTMDSRVIEVNDSEMYDTGFNVLPS